MGKIQSPNSRANAPSRVVHDLGVRRSALQNFSRVFRAYGEEHTRALRDDLGLPAMEAYLGHIYPVQAEAAAALSGLKTWMGKRRRATPLNFFGAQSLQFRNPLGRDLILGPWNYPIQLMAVPLIHSIAAGNTAILKPSEHAPQCAALLEKMIGEVFSPDYVRVVQGGADVSRQLIEEADIDHIFFTGGNQVGRQVRVAAAMRGLPVTLELGGKSPCFVDGTVPFEKAAERIAWGKFFNLGQTCIAPDYLLVAEEAKEPLIRALRAVLARFYGDDPLRSPDLARVVNTHHFARLQRLLAGHSILAGGQLDEGTLRMAPTLVDLDGRADFLETPLMQEEIFGPILPIRSYRTVDEALAIVAENPDPLSFSVFSRDRSLVEQVIRESRSGNVTVNDCLIQFINPALRLGSVDVGGTGSHGEDGVSAFSHDKAVIWQNYNPVGQWFNQLRYPPYGNKLRTLKPLMWTFGRHSLRRYLSLGLTQ